MARGGPWSAVLGTALAVLTASCLPRLSPDEISRGRVVVTPAEDSVAPHGRPSAPDSLELQYLGVAGWVIRTPRTLLLTGPLLTRPGMLAVAAGETLEPDTAAILEALAAWEVGSLEEASAILVGHGHYDHLLDAPWIAARLAPRARILGNETTRLQVLALAPALGLDTTRVEDVSPQAASATTPGTWIRVAPDVRVLPIRSDHTPHFAGYTLYSGIRRVPLPEPPGPAAEWLDGATLAFLVDILDDDGGVRMRLYYQDAIPREPAGQLPAAVLDAGPPVSAALLVPASFAEARWHPEAVVANLRPRTVLVQHWEDFFSPATDPAEPVIFTVLPHFLDRLKRVMGCQACVRLADPGARFLYPLR